jgi:uncharacterized protein YdhG (YjbR/CyaY superfamily)
MKNDPLNQISSVDVYIDSLSSPAREFIIRLRETIRLTAPEAAELISYGMPAFRMGKILVYYAAHKAHIGLYPASTTVMQVFREELAGYETSKGAIRFPFDKGIPTELVERIIRFRLTELEEQAAEKKRRA